MEFRMLGPLEAWHGEVQVDLGDLQQRFILVVLLLHANKPVPTSRLIEIVWGRRGKPKTNLVPGYITKLRKAFRDAGAAGEAIVTTPTGYLLRVDHQELDTNRFTRLCDEAAEARQAGNSAQAATLLHDAVDLWRGRFLEDLDVDRIGGGEVISLDEALIDALGDLAELELAAGNHRWVRDRLRPAVHSDPSRQRLAILLMRAMLANGDRVEATKVYYRTRDALDEYGMDGSADLRGVARLAQYGEPHSTLPPRPRRFTGRAAELEAIDAVAEHGVGSSVVWLSGMPGVGKTALAVEAAYLLRGRYLDARLFVTLNGYTPDVEPMATSGALVGLLTDLGVPTERIPPTLGARAALYQDTLAGTRTLVVLDNARSADHVRPLLPDDPDCLAIVTSRHSGDLEGCEHIRLGPLSIAEAAHLFRNLVGHSRLDDRAEQVEEVVARCGRLPLPIRVVASQLRRHPLWPVEHLLSLLDEAHPQRDEQGFAACRISYQQLTDPQQTMFRLVALMPGHDLNMWGAAALTDSDPAAARHTLDDLHAASLVEEAIPERYHMLDPLKDFATTALPVGNPDETRKALDQLLDFYLVTTSSAIATAFPFDRAQQPRVDQLCPVTPTFHDQQAALNWLATERTNLVAAIRYAAIHHRPDHTWQLAVLMGRYLNTSGHIEDWIETLELAKTTVLAHPGNLHGQAQVLLRLSHARWRSGELTHAVDLAAEALPRWIQLGDLSGEADTLCAIAVPTLELGDHPQAITHFEAALAQYQEIDDKRGQANALSIIGHLNELHGQLEQAERQQLEAVRLLRMINHTQGLAHALDNLGSVQQRLGHLDQAMDNHQQALHLATQLGDRGIEAYTLNNIGNVHRRHGRLDDAEHHQQRAQAIADTIADPNLRTKLYLDRAATHRARDDLAAALGAFQAAFDLASGTGDRGLRAHANRGIAQTLHALDDHEHATEYWRSAEAEFTDLHQPEAHEIRQERSTLKCACTTNNAPPEHSP